MSVSTRCTALTLLLVGLLAALALTRAGTAGAQQTQKQEKKKATPQPGTPVQPGVMPRWDFNPPSSFITLPSDPNLKKRFDAIPDYIQEELWPEATRSIQSFLD